MKIRKISMVTTLRMLFAFTSCMAAIAPAMAAKTPPGQAPDPGRALMPYISTDHSVTLPDGRVIHMVCMGHGRPTVVLTAGYGDWSMTWFKVQPRLARLTRTCAWDRAGFGMSGPSPRPQDIDHTTRDLEAALKYGHVRPPYVLVGHSLGGLETLRFKDSHPAEVVGMVLVDPTFPGEGKVMKRVAPALYSLYRNKTALTARDMQCAADMKAGKLKPGASDTHHCLQQPPVFPKRMRDTLVAFDRHHPGIFTTRASLGAHILQDMNMAVDPTRDYGTMPLIVLTAENMQPMPPGYPKAIKAQAPAMLAAAKKHHEQLARLSAHGTDRVVPRTSHYIQLIRPNVVVAAIDTVIRETRASTGKHPAGRGKAH